MKLASKLDTELKQYSIKSESWDDFLEVWQKLVPIRKRFGFDLLFALADREKNVFTWAIQHAGDFEAAGKAYQADPEGVALEVIGSYVASADTTKVARLAI